MNGTPRDAARSTLLAALDQLDGLPDDAVPTVVIMFGASCPTGDVRETLGWQASPAPSWTIEGLIAQTLAAVRAAHARQLD